MAPDPRVRQQLTAHTAENRRRGRQLASWVAEPTRLTAETETDLAATFDRIAASGSGRAGHLRTLAAEARRYAVHERDEAARWAARAATWPAGGGPV
jgi:hypothetical protein